MALQKLYKMRCSPTCPYEDCVILTNIPPEMRGGGKDGEPDNNSSNQSSADGKGGQSNQAQGQNQENGKGGSPSNGQTGSPDNGNSGDSNGGGGGQQGGDSDSSGGSTEEDARKQLEADKSTRQPQEDPGKSQEEKSEPGKQENSPDKPGDKEESGTEKSDSDGGEGDKEEPEPQEEKSEDEGDQETPDWEEIEVDEKIQYGYQYIPFDKIGQQQEYTHGQQGTKGNTGLANLGKHLKREPIITDQVFQARLKNIMKDNAFDRPVRGRKRGRLDMRALHKVPMKAENVFTLKEARKNKHYNVILLVDQSGSMFDGKITVAADVATFLARALGRVDVQYAVIGYDGSYRYHKKFTEVATDDRLKKMKFDIEHTGGGGTALMKPMKEAYRQLRQTPEWQNIIISISDGWPNEAPELLKAYVKGNRHVADYIDIGINSRTIMDGGFTVGNVQELKPLVIKELRRRIKRG